MSLYKQITCISIIIKKSQIDFEVVMRTKTLLIMIILQFAYFTCYFNKNINYYHNVFKNKFKIKNMANRATIIIGGN